MNAPQNITVEAQNSTNDTWFMGGIGYDNPVNITLAPNSSSVLALVANPARDVEVCVNSHIYDETRVCSLVTS